MYYKRRTFIFSFSHNMSEANASYCGVKRNNASYCGVKRNNASYCGAAAEQCFICQGGFMKHA